MRFRVTRVSLENNCIYTIAPCAEAISEIRVVPQIVSKRVMSQSFLASLSDIPEFQDYIKMREETWWYVDFNSLEDLTAFITKYGSCVIKPNNHIEIYDDWRE